MSSPAPSTAPPGEHPLHVKLPLALGPRADRAVRDAQLQLFVNRATLGKDTKRRAAFAKTFGPRVDALRAHAGQIKQHTLDHLDHYLSQYIEAAERAGWVVHFARDAAQANAICLEIARQASCRLCVKSKSMVTEEIGLVPCFKQAGIETIETDLGEFVVQLDHDAPSHIVTPMIHKNRAAVARAFVRELGAEYTEDAYALTAIARRYLREKFRQADLGVSGGNFLIAESGAVVVCTNEGNAAMSLGAPPLHIAVVGIEKLIPRREHLAVFLKLLARSSTAQPLTVYTHILRGPAGNDEPDGPRQRHIVLLDNGRSRLLAPETREMLRCIRCGACLNACPVYRKIGGHAYGSVYSGPIGAVLTPLLRGLGDFKDLPHASSLCGACYEACPVHIDIPRHLIRLRREMITRRITNWRERAMFGMWAWCLRGSLRYRAATWCLRRILRWLGRDASDDQRKHAAPASYADQRWITHAGGPLAGWTCVRDLITPPKRSFRHWWRNHHKQDQQP